MLLYSNKLYFNKQKLMKTLKRFMKKYGYMDGSLANIDLVNFDLFFHILMSEIEQQSTLIFPIGLQKTAKIRLILQSLQSSYQSTTLYLIIKKISLLFMLIRKYTQKKMLDEKLVTFFEEQVQTILKKDIRSLLEHKQKKSSSIDKIVKYIRQLSGEKDRVITSRTKIQKFSEKSALRETVSKVIEPFCSYILKLLQDNSSYSHIFDTSLNSTPFADEGAMRWKMINWSRTLSQITRELYRLCKYFKEDLKGVIGFVTFLCTKDIAIYYDLIKQSVSAEAVLVLQELSLQQPGGSRSRQCKELKRAIEQMLFVKERINFIFGNKELKNWLCYFSKPRGYKLYDEEESKEVEAIIHLREGEQLKQSCWTNVAKCEVEDAVKSLYTSASEDEVQGVDEVVRKEALDDKSANFCRIHQDLLGTQLLKSKYSNRTFMPKGTDCQNILLKNSISNLRKQKKILN